MAKQKTERAEKRHLVRWNGTCSFFSLFPFWVVSVAIHGFLGTVNQDLSQHHPTHIVAHNFSVTPSLCVFYIYRFRLMAC